MATKTWSFTTSRKCILTHLSYIAIITILSRTSTVDADKTARYVKSFPEFSTKVFKVIPTPYDSNRGTPADKRMLRKRKFVRKMMKHAWRGYA